MPIQRDHHHLIHQRYGHQYPGVKMVELESAGGRVPGIITADVAGRRTLDYAGGEGLSA